MLRRCILAGVLAFGSLCGDGGEWKFDNPDRGWNDDALVLKYFHNSEMQRQYAWELLGQYPLCGDETILDFGCGDGKISAEVANCVPRGHVVGVDLSEQMISFSKRRFPNDCNPTLTFQRVANIDFADIEIDGVEKFDRIHGMCVFHLVKNPITVLNNFRKVLKPDGRLLLVAPGRFNPSCFLAAGDVLKGYGIVPPWKRSSSGKVGPSMRDRSGIEEVFSEAKWEMQKFDEVRKDIVFINRQEFVTWLVGTASALWEVGPDVADEFFGKVVDRYVEIYPAGKREDGTYRMEMVRFHIVAQPV